jgi:hypothetical protein
MYIYEALLLKRDNKFIAVILKLSHDEPCCDTVMERECVSEDEANIWIDDELNRLTHGRGIWDL